MLGNKEKRKYFFYLRNKSSVLKHLGKILIFIEYRTMQRISQQNIKRENLIEKL